MKLVNCPKCNASVIKGRFNQWPILLSIIASPFWLFCLKRKPTICTNCDYKWQEGGTKTKWGKGLLDELYEKKKEH